jgi:O-methyltransferase
MRITIPGLNVSVTINRGTPPPTLTPPPTPSGYSGDGISVQWRILDALTGPRFKAAYAAGIQTPHNIGGGGDLHIHWRVYTCIWAAQQGLHLAGDFVECGVNTGIFSRAICEYLDFANVKKTFYLFDTFQGIPEGQALPEEREHVRSNNATTYRECYEETVKTFEPFPNVRLVRGTVPQTLSTVPIDRVAYLSIDMNLVHPEIAALEFFWDRLVPGALVVLDDYAFEAHRPQHEAIDAFAAKRNVAVYTSPTGQGLIVRPPS